MDRYRHISCADWEALPAALAEMRNDLVNRVIPEQIESGKPFGRISAEIWEDSGRIIAFPQLSRTERIDVTGCQVQCLAIAGEVSALDASELDDSAYESAVKAIVQRMSSEIHRAFHGAKFPLQVYDQDGNAI